MTLSWSALFASGMILPLAAAVLCVRNRRVAGRTVAHRRRVQLYSDALAALGYSCFALFELNYHHTKLPALLLTLYALSAVGIRWYRCRRQPQPR